MVEMVQAEEGVEIIRTAAARSSSAPSEALAAVPEGAVSAEVAVSVVLAEVHLAEAELPEDGRITYLQLS
jgi:hypothetical protein